MMKVLLVDGPMRGQVVDSEGALAIRCLDYGAVSDVLQEEVPVRTYYVHRFALAGRTLLLGSLEHSPFGAPVEDMFWELLASDAAKQVALGAEGGQQ